QLGKQREFEAIDDAIKKAPQDLQPGLNQHRGDFKDPADVKAVVDVLLKQRSDRDKSVRDKAIESLSDNEIRNQLWRRRNQFTTPEDVHRAADELSGQRANKRFEERESQLGKQREFEAIDDAIKKAPQDLQPGLSTHGGAREIPNLNDTQRGFNLPDLSYLCDRFVRLNEVGVKNGAVNNCLGY
uniref:hypothetical protein n=1 Tax=Burkholderia orbicola TaxID=2978683 RepID=UPI002FE2A403